MLHANLQDPFKPIGIIRTPFKQSTGTPIQSSVAKGAAGTVELFPEFEAGLKDLGEFERVWLIYQFDRASKPQLLVRPYLDSCERGIFATRSPARPNRIGMSPVRLIRIEGRRLHVADVDILDGTPLLDLKPYVPAFDHFPAARVGWYKNRLATEAVADDRFEAKKTTAGT
jgi:tRNA-Thr(GGU) m(6)t(6)A37 methyltransferase TsaA